VQVHATPQPGTVPARLRRLTHMGRDLQAELVLDSEEVVVAQFPREEIDYRSLRPGDRLHVVSRQAHSFVPDYSI
jgi:sulfate transport system ATP-binding protein